MTQIEVIIQHQNPNEAGHIFVVFQEVIKHHSLSMTARIRYLNHVKHPHVLHVFLLEPTMLIPFMLYVPSLARYIWGLRSCSLPSKHHQGPLEILCVMVL
jgi:hypothetical protein